MKTILLIFLCLAFFSVSCARVSVEAPKEPIKVDISMRLDIYQHISKDIDDIESIVSGTNERPKTKDNESKVNFLSIAYAEEGLSPEVERAALNRRDRRPELVSWQEKGIIGENKSALAESRASGFDPSLERLVKEENNDRMVIYQALAEKNGVSVEEIQGLYARRLQESALSGTPIEVFNGATGEYEWRIK